MKENPNIYLEEVYEFYNDSLIEKKVLKNKLESETELEQLDRLATEYEIYDEIDVSEKKFKNMIKISKDNPKIWLDYSTFLLRQKRYFKAE